MFMRPQVIVIRLVLYISVGLCAASYILKDRLPPQREILDELYTEPRQKKITAEPFTTTAGQMEYVVSPLYEYELYGLIVSYHHANAWWDIYHRDWKDKLNVKDLCVIWGKNVESGLYRRMKFKNGSWTCYVSVNAATAQRDWSKFDIRCLSNNHLLSDDEEIKRLIMDARKGDQIRLKGYLSRYSNMDNNFRRGTSLTRNDTGSGACETIYVTDFSILKKANRLWWALLFHSGLLSIACIIVLVGIKLAHPF